MERQLNVGQLNVGTAAPAVRRAQLGCFKGASLRNSLQPPPLSNPLKPMAPRPKGLLSCPPKPYTLILGPQHV
jgi:hypothetical protein